MFSCLHAYIGFTLESGRVTQYWSGQAPQMRMDGNRKEKEGKVGGEMSSCLHT